ncbi:hypothetical protein LTR66_002452 [Elasticomyces elasticus]|nr:hypothetical protein LTR50_004639 [Elasticomyces elasticus]KAK4998306.1 hypothetical protein LTR66_002452 [Elasticomyces elasticus]
MALTHEENPVGSRTSDELAAENMGAIPENIANREDASIESEEEKGTFDERSKGLVVVIMLALSLAVFLSALDTTIITVALPTISEHFHSSAGYTWIGSAYLLANAASTPLWGKLSDIFGRKPMLLVANLAFLIGSLIAGLSINIGMLIVARAIQGIGSGGLLTLVDIVISDMFSLRTRGAYLGVIGGVWAIACAIGPIIGGAFTGKVSWRWCFYINLPLDGLAFFIILFFLDVKTPRTPIVEGLLAIDWLGTLAVVGATLVFLFGLQYGGLTYPWGSATVICLLIFGILLFVVFFIIEWKFAKYPVMPLRIFKYRSNCGVLLAVFLHGFVFIAEFYFLPLYFQAVRGSSPLLSGVYILPSALGTGLAAIATGAFIGATGQYLPPIYTGFTLMLLGYGLLIDLDANSGWAKLIIFQVIVGFGVGPNFQAPLVALQTHIRPGDIATGTATFNFVRNIGSSISVIIGQVVFQNQMAKKQPQLIAALGPATAARLNGANAGANTQVIDALPPAQKTVARAAFADSLRPMWIMYTCFAVVALLSVLLIQRTQLTSKHQELEVGLEAEKKNEAARKAEKEAKDIEKGRESHH